MMILNRDSEFFCNQVPKYLDYSGENFADIYSKFPFFFS